MVYASSNSVVRFDKMGLLLLQKPRWSLFSVFPEEASECQLGSTGLCAFLFLSVNESKGYE